MKLQEKDKEAVSDMFGTCHYCLFRENFNCVLHKERVAPENLGCDDFHEAEGSTVLEDKVVELIQNGNSYRKIAAMLDISHSKVFRIASKHKHYKVINISK